MIPNFEKITIIPYLFMESINNSINIIEENIKIDFEEEKKKYQMYIINDIKKVLNNTFNNNDFWSYVMGIRYCNHKYKNPKNKIFCGKRIDIVDGNGNFHDKCYRHISNKIYVKDISKKDREKLCLSLNNKGRLCCSYKTYGNYCIYHKDKYLEEEIDIFLNIEYNLDNNFYDKYIDNLKINLINNEIEILSSIDIDIYQEYVNINYISESEIDIKYNNNFCTENNCYNKIYNEENYCENCLNIIDRGNDSIICDYTIYGLDKLNLNFIEKDIKKYIDIEKNNIKNIYKYSGIILSNIIDINNIIYKNDIIYNNYIFYEENNIFNKILKKSNLYLFINCQLGNTNPLYYETLFHKRIVFSNLLN